MSSDSGSFLGETLAHQAFNCTSEMLVNDLSELHGAYSPLWVVLDSYSFEFLTRRSGITYLACWTTFRSCERLKNHHFQYKLWKMWSSILHTAVTKSKLGMTLGMTRVHPPRVWNTRGRIKDNLYAVLSEFDRVCSKRHLLTCLQAALVQTISQA